MALVTMTAPSDTEIAAVRALDRFRTRLVGAPNERLPASDHALPRFRVLYAIADPRPDAPPPARDPALRLRMDGGYPSRPVPGLVADASPARRPAPRGPDSAARG